LLQRNKGNTEEGVELLTNPYLLEDRIIEEVLRKACIPLMEDMGNVCALPAWEGKTVFLSTWDDGLEVGVFGCYPVGGVVRPQHECNFISSTNTMLPSLSTATKVGKNLGKLHAETEKSCANFQSWPELAAFCQL
jgi:hypothetical protein